MWAGRHWDDVDGRLTLAGLDAETLLAERLCNVIYALMVEDRMNPETSRHAAREAIDEALWPESLAGGGEYASIQAQIREREAQIQAARVAAANASANPANHVTRPPEDWPQRPVPAPIPPAGVPEPPPAGIVIPAATVPDGVPMTAAPPEDVAGDWGARPAPPGGQGG